MTAMGIEQWFLSADERGNDWTRLDRGRPAGEAWSSGNDVTPLVHGAQYLPELLRCIRGLRSGDVLMFTDWRGDPDQLMGGEDTEVERVLCEAATRGVVVKGL